MYKIPSPKFGIYKPLTWIKYVVLALFVIILPLVIVDEFGIGSTWFCKYICPAGTLEAGIPLMFLRPELQDLIGGLFFNKLTILILLLIWMVFTSRPFCRTLCPLGAIYSLFNKVSLFTMRWDKEACTHCRACETVCPMGVKFYETPNSLECIRCLKCYQACKFDAISFGVKGIEQPHLITRRTSKEPAQF
jgi:ferredoxin